MPFTKSVSGEVKQYTCTSVGVAHACNNDALELADFRASLFLSSLMMRRDHFFAGRETRSTRGTRGRSDIVRQPEEFESVNYRLRRANCVSELRTQSLWNAFETAHGQRSRCVSWKTSCPFSCFSDRLLALEILSSAQHRTITKNRYSLTLCDVVCRFNSTHNVRAAVDEIFFSY